MSRPAFTLALCPQARFWTEIYDGAKLFYLSGIQHGKYLKREIFNLARFISVMKLRPLTWRLAHPFALIDRFEVCNAWIGVVLPVAQVPSKVHVIGD